MRKKHKKSPLIPGTGVNAADIPYPPHTEADSKSASPAFTVLAFLSEIEGISDEELLALSRLVEERGWRDPVRTKAILGRHMASALRAAFYEVTGRPGTQLEEAYHHAINESKTT